MVIVFGSTNLDIIVRVDQLPAPGETVSGSDRLLSPGGKGANQALAARRMGADVTFVGATGRDDFGARATDLLRSDGVDLSHLATVDRPTGIALILVSEAGENSIVVSPGANHAVRAAMLDDVVTGPGDVLVLQGEVPHAEILAAIAWGKARDLRVLLNLAPFWPIPAEALADVDTLVVNETESAALGETLNIAANPEAFAAAIAEKFGLIAIVTLGGAGLVGHDGRGALHLDAFPVEVVDTTGAGDAFAGALAASIAAGRDLPDSLRIASAVGALACTAIGAQQSLPRWEAVEAFLHGHGDYLHPALSHFTLPPAAR